MSSPQPVLWSFRRCPYAMRARLAVRSSGVGVRLREIVLRNKPEEFLAASAKGTVPVLVDPGGNVIDESLDVMFWALGQADPEDWLAIWRQDPDHCRHYLDQLDGPFKTHLDRYKYASRYIKDGDADDDIKATTLHHRTEGAAFISALDKVLAEKHYLSGARPGLLDYATLPFIRQFRIADMDWFDARDWPALHPWLQDFLTSDRFADIMQKYPQWLDRGEEFTL